MKNNYDEQRDFGDENPDRIVFPLIDAEENESKSTLTKEDLYWLTCPDLQIKTTKI